MLANLTCGGHITPEARSPNQLSKLTVNIRKPADIGVLINAAPGQTGNLFEIDSPAGTQLFRIGSNGNIVMAQGSFSAGSNMIAGTGNQVSWSNRSVMQSPADGVIEMTNNATTNFTGLKLGGTTSSFPYIKVNGANLNLRVADDSADCNLTLNQVTKYNGATTAGIGIPTIYGIDSRTGLTTADGAPITVYAVPSGAGQVYRIAADIFATAAVTGTATYTLTWTENATTQTLVTTATAINVLGTVTAIIRPDASTNITAQLTGTFTGTFAVTGVAEQLK